MMEVYINRLTDYGLPISSSVMSDDKLRVDALIKRVNKIIDGGVRMADLARYLGKSWSQCSEWVRTKRYTPSAEVALAMQEWCAMHEPMLGKSLNMEKRDDGSIRLTMDNEDLTALEQELWSENHSMRQLLGAKL